MLEELKELMRNKDVLFVGVGNVLKNDDGIGVIICRAFERDPRLSCLVVETGIEKYIGKIDQINPTSLVLVDCMYFPGKKPGYYEFLPVDAIKRFALNTHNISLGSIADFFKPPVFILGIHPENTTFGEEISAPVQKAANEIISEIEGSI